MVALQMGQPVLRAPAGGVGGIDGRHGNSAVIRHLGQTVPQLCGGDAGDHVPVATSSSTTGGPVTVSFTALLASIDEVKVLDHHGGSSMVFGDAEDAADHRRQPPVSSARRQTGQRQLDRGGCPDRVAVCGKDRHVQVLVVDIDRYHRMAANILQ